MKQILRGAVLSMCLVVASGSALAADPFAENVRTTPALTAEEERKSFHLPPGFEIQLVASEPDIGKPFNIAFDAKGRLWITASREYPFPPKSGKGAMDRIIILDDFDDNAHARKISTFADNLNIPIGIYPYQDGCIAYSIPNISAYHDTDGNGKADKVETLVGPFSFDRDTHGMSSNYRRGLDGWIYGCHGFNNITHAKALDGSAVDLNSGNTYRFRPDGSHVEQFTWGQTNPFGLAFDHFGNLYSSDSHSKPFYQLVRGGYYEGIGKKDDGLGFAPMMMRHFHNSTAIASTFLYTAGAWPAEYRDNCFCGNVVTSRINRDSVTYQGTTPVAKEEPDFLMTQDPWFRPVQLQMGPDGQMWVADFYNRIIGHYEVPLTHPGRDHDHGRIWRIVYKGDAKTAPPPWRGDLTKASVGELLETLKSPNLMLRMLATDQLTDRFGKDAVGDLSAFIAKDGNTSSQIVHAMWAIARQGDYAATIWPAAVASKHADPVVRVHAMRVLGELREWLPGDMPSPPAVLTAALQDPDVRVQRVAAEALGRHPKADFVEPLVQLYQRVSPQDSHFLYTVKVALREVLKSPGTYAALPTLDSTGARLIADVSVAVPTEESGKWVAAFIADPANNAIGSAPLVHHAMRYAPAADTEKLTAMVRSRFANDIDLQLALLKGMQDAATQKGVPLGTDARGWMSELAVKLLTTPAADAKQTATRLQAGAEMARSLADPRLGPALQQLMTNRTAALPARIAAAKALGACDEKLLQSAMDLAADASQPITLREACVDAAAEHAWSRDALPVGLAKAPGRLQSRMGLGLASTHDGAERLLAAVAAGVASPRLLQEAAIHERLKSANVSDLEPRIAALTKGIPALDVQIQDLIDVRRAAYPKAKPNVDAGFKVFTASCAACHSIDGKGGMVGPQLDGIGNRGLDRLLEDVLDPNRSVDPAFHSWNVKLKDGTEISGIQRREEGATFVYADPTGKEIVVPKSQIAERRESGLSLMPSNFGEIIPPDDFNHLIGFLLSKNAKQ